MPNSKPAGIVVVTVAATLLSGCVAPPTSRAETDGIEASAGYEPSYESAECPDPNFAALPAADLGPAYECGYLTVPENRSDPAGATIRLAVARIPAESPTAESHPLVYLDGGPGGSALVSAPAQVALGINAGRDVIFVDQRGTYHSEPNLTCPEIDVFLAEAVSLPFTDPATGVRGTAATTACRDRLADEGIELAAYNTAENAHDIADLRVALGIDEWDVYGVSYGTDLALTVLRDHPEGVRSVVLDSVVPPSMSIIPEFWPAAAAAYRNLFDACAAQPACAAAYPDLEQEFTDTVVRLAETPLTVTIPDAGGGGGTVDVVVDGYQLANATILLLASGPRTWSLAPAMIHGIAQGDGTAAATFVRDFVPPANLVGLGLQWGAFCQEFVAQTDVDDVVARGREALPGFPDDVLRFLPQIPWAFADCATWDVGEAPEARAPVESDVPTLIMGGTFDAVTSVSWGDTLTGLSNSQSVAFPGLGHQVLAQSPCPVTLMRGFLAVPDAAVDDSCVGEMMLEAIVTP